MADKQKSLEFKYPNEKIINWQKTFGVGINMSGPVDPLIHHKDVRINMF